jgi:hypothetical protein
VLAPFSFDPVHPYAGGQHRGVDIGADAAGESIVAPAAGTVSFAGTVPTSGRSVTIQTPDGYSVTLTHLGSALVVKGQTVAEQEPVGTVGPSGTAEVDGPYVHLGIRTTSDPNGYLDPLGFLPPAATGDVTNDPTSSQPGSGSGSSTATGGAPSSSTGSSSPSGNTATSSTGDASSSHRQGRTSAHEEERTRKARSETRSDRPSQRPAVSQGEEAAPTSRPAIQGHAERSRNSSRRPVHEPAAAPEPTRVYAGHAVAASAPVAQPSSTRRQTSGPLLPLILNGVAALVALGAALAAARGRRGRRPAVSPGTATRVLPLPSRRVERWHASRAA